MTAISDLNNSLLESARAPRALAARKFSSAKKKSEQWSRATSDERSIRPACHECCC